MPKTEPKNAIKALNDPANLESPDPAIKRAAEIKKAEDLKPQKIKAIKYLTSIGCGCYDKDGSVTDALVAASEDCTEDVRLTTLKEIKTAASGKCCSNCGQVCCCNDKMLKKLAQIAYERDEFGCYTEPSKRVREAAAEALVACCPGSPPLEILSSQPEVEPESPQPVPEREKSQDAVPEREAGSFNDSGSGIQSLPYLPEAGELSPSDKGEEELVQQFSASRANTRQPLVPDGIARMRRILANSPPQISATPNPRGGVVLAYDAETATAYVHFEKPDIVVMPGTTLYLRPDPRVGAGFNGLWQVVEATAGCANLQPVGTEGVDRIRVGDHANFGTPPVAVAPVSFVP